MRVIIRIILFYILSSSSFAQIPTITFENACIKGNSITIAAVGDVLLHEPLQRKASRQGFASLWQEAIPFIKSADIAYANLEGPMAAGIDELGRQKNKNYHNSNMSIYTGFPLFNYHPSLAGALKDSGFDIVSTANNHALDRFSIGIDKTIKALDRAGLAYVGTRPRGTNESWVHIINKHGFRIAWISCTEMTNGLDDRYKQVLYCYKKKDKQWILDTIQELKSQVDAIIISPHWGEEYQQEPSSTQIQFAKQVLDAGALVVIGSHPHVLQPLQRYLTKDGRETLIMYSLGNFVSYQKKNYTRNTIILLLGLTQTPEGAIINGVRFVPMYMQNASGWQDVHLAPINNNTIPSANIFSHIMPMGNAIYSPISFNHQECY